MEHKTNIGLVIPIHNRPQYLKRCFDSLLKCYWDDYNFKIVIVNDCSTFPAVIQLMQEFSEAIQLLSKKKRDNIKVYTFNLKQNVGIKGSLGIGIDFCFDNIDCDYVINLDSDAIVKPDFINRLIELKEIFIPEIVTGFNCSKEANPILETGLGWAKKKLANGINMCFDKKQYHKYIEPSLLITGGDWDYQTSCNAVEFIITVPSVVQHIGLESSQGHYPPDIACDFYSIELPDVTLFGIDAHNPAGLLRAAGISQKDIKFGAVKMITERLFSGREAYSEWVIKHLHEHFETSHVLLIHPDGYVVNYEAWDDGFLNYDYIGATWGYKDNMNVGNGGFTLRSKKLCEAVANEPEITQYHPEDDVICRKYRPLLEAKYGIKFAPEEVANRFSIEAYGANAFPNGNRYSGQFGFHSVHVDFTNSNIPEFIRYKQ